MSDSQRKREIGKEKGCRLAPDTFHCLLVDNFKLK